MIDPTFWLAKLSKLRVGRARGYPAPHKPLLLLAVFRRMDEGEPLPRTQPLTAELAFQFLTLWTVVARRQRQRPDVRLPFHHLRSDGVWSGLTRDGLESAEFRSTASVAIDPDFLAFAADPHNRLNAERVLVRTYFQPNEQVGLRELLNIPADGADPTTPAGSPLILAEAMKQGREARFRLRVMAAYNYTCALTGYRLTTVTGASAVDAAHIHQFADSRNNDLRNGLALSRTAHWLFDQGLWTLTDDYAVLVAREEFTESGPDALRLSQYHDRRLLCLPSDESVRPAPVHLDWHRRKKFHGR